MLQAKLKPTNNAPWIYNATTNAAGTSDTVFNNSVICASSTQITNYSSTWIIDSGDTHHLTPYLHHVIQPKFINSELHLPNGNIVTHIGTVQVSSDITLTDVLVVPSF